GPTGASYAQDCPTVRSRSSQPSVTNNGLLVRFAAQTSPDPQSGYKGLYEGQGGRKRPHAGTGALPLRSRRRPGAELDHRRTKPPPRPRSNSSTGATARLTTMATTGHGNDVAACPPDP